MACFLVPTTEAIVTTVVKKTKGDAAVKANAHKHPFLKRLNWLNNMLWGGAALLAFEHVWHGEVTFSFPFLTGGVSALQEMATSGVAMAVVVTAVWAGMVAVTNAIAKRTARVPELEAGEQA